MLRYSLKHSAMWCKFSGRVWFTIKWETNLARYLEIIWRIFGMQKPASAFLNCGGNSVVTNQLNNKSSKDDSQEKIVMKNWTHYRTRELFVDDCHAYSCRKLVHAVRALCWNTQSMNRFIYYQTYALNNLIINT